MKKKITVLIALLFVINTVTIFCQSNTIPSSDYISVRVDSVLKLMTPDEKIGQLNQYNDDNVATGPVTLDNDKESQVLQGKVGSILNCMGAERTRKW